MTRQARISIIVLAVLHAVGIIGILTPFRPYFVALTPLNLLITAYLLIRNQSEISLRTVWIMLMAYFLGLGVEIAGVSTGVIFGEYKYGIVLGPKIAGAPMMIGINYLILLFASGELARWMFNWFGWRIIAGAFSMVLLDILIEPVAISLEWWSWTCGIPPLTNYVGWFVVSLLMHALYAVSLNDQNNRIGAAVYGILFAFFLLLNFAFA
ncbi:MAG: carotenoid biosynthesis protein [Flavobacteriales bacterium]|nr:carotenoid biosynthesis protein [Flavobacteriales bacterium]